MHHGCTCICACMSTCNADQTRPDQTRPDPSFHLTFARKSMQLSQLVTDRARDLGRLMDALDSKAHAACCFAAASTKEAHA